jgi:hypothetical protein
MIKIMLSTLMLVTFSVSAFAKSKSTAWDQFRNSNFVSYVNVANHSYKESVGTPEFLASVEFIPYNSKGEAIDTLVQLSYRSPIPKTILIGTNYFFSHVVPFRYFFEGSHFDMSQVAYFKVKYRVVESDFFINQKVITRTLKLTPKGFTSFNKKVRKPIVRERFLLQTPTTSPISMSGEIYIN